MLKTKSQPVYQLELNLKIREEFTSLNDAAKQTGISRPSISGCCNKTRRTAGGYKWVFVQDYDQYCEDVLKLWKFPELDEKIIEIVNSSNRRYKHILVPKYMYFIHLMITARRKEQRSKKINLEKFAEIICDNNGLACKIIKTLVGLGVVHVVTKAHQVEGEKWTSAEYSLTPEYRNKFVSQEMFTEDDGMMIRKMKKNLEDLKDTGVGEVLEANIRKSYRGESKNELAIMDQPL